MFDESQDELSKSEIKRQLQLIKALAVDLSKLNLGQIKTIPLDDATLKALLELQAITSNVAKKRQTQYLTKLLSRQENLSAVFDAYQALAGEKKALDAQFHLAERWREQLLSDASAMTTFMNEYAHVEAQQLRHAIQKAKREQQKGVNHGAYKALFRLIKQVIDENV